MTKLILHPRTKAAIQNYLQHPAHALILTGPAGSGKGSVAYQLAADLTGVEDKDLHQQPYIRLIVEENHTTIGVEDIRAINAFLKHKVVGKQPRIIIIETAERMGQEAQNALLKNLEEPPQSTFFILTTAAWELLLPTIRSRAQRLDIIRPTSQQLDEYFTAQGFSTAAVQQARLMSGGLPGLMQFLLADDSAHPLRQAAEVARQLLAASTFERLAMVDGLSKDRGQAQMLTKILQEMSHVALQQSLANRWQNILALSYHAEEQLQANAQPKLVLMHLFLNL